MTPMRRSRAERRTAFEADTRLIDEFRRLNADFFVEPSDALAARIEALRVALAQRGILYDVPPGRKPATGDPSATA